METLDTALSFDLPIKLFKICLLLAQHGLADQSGKAKVYLPHHHSTSVALQKKQLKKKIIRLNLLVGLSLCFIEKCTLTHAMDHD